MTDSAEDFGPVHVEFALSIDPMTWKPVVVQVVEHESLLESAKFPIGSPEEAVDMASTVIAVALKAEELADFMERKDPQTHEQAIEAVQLFGHISNSEFN